MEERAEDSDAAIEEAAVVTGTGIAVTPSDPLEVLCVCSALEADVMTTGTTVVSGDSVDVLESAVLLPLLVTGTGTTVAASELVTVLEVTPETAELDEPMTGTAELERTSEPEALLRTGTGTTVMVDVSELVLEPERLSLLLEEVAAGTPVDSSDASNDSALDKTLEN